MSNFFDLLDDCAEQLDGLDVEAGRGAFCYTRSMNFLNIHRNRDRLIEEGEINELASERDIIDHYILTAVEMAAYQAVYQIQHGIMYKRGPKDLRDRGWKFKGSFPSGPYLFTLWFRKEHTDFSFAIDCTMVGERVDEFKTWWSMVAGEEEE